MAINASQLEQKSLLRLTRYTFANPIAAAANAIVTSLDPSSGATVGTALTQAAAFATTVTFRHARRATLVLTDASAGAGGLSVSVRIAGHRFGVPQSEILTVTCTDGSATTGTSTLCYDAISSIVPSALTSTGAGDALTMGISADLGLPFPIEIVTDVTRAVKIVSGNVETIIAISSTTVDVTRSMLVHGTTITKADDVFEVEFLVSRTLPMFGNSGAFA